MSQVSTGSASTRLRPPRLLLCVSLIFAARVFGAFMAPIADCDEVFNYWEPVHYLLFGTGLQTWEYSPFYALRSYLYLVLHASPLHFALTAMNYVSELIPELALEVNVHQVFGMPTKVVLFYLLRLLLAGASSLAEARFVMAATRAMHRTLGMSARWAGTYLLVFTAFAPGQFIAATAMLPQSFVLVCLQFAHAAWLEASTETDSKVASRLGLPLGGYSSAIWWAAVAALVGCWPFVLVVILPMALHTLIAYGPWRSAKVGAMVLALLLSASLMVDKYFYGKWTLALWNLFKYNANSKHGPELYGVEPASYYIKNLALNWNLVFVFGALGPLFAVLVLTFTPGKRRAAVAFLRWVSGAMLWAAIMFSQPHKEERFLYPIYHLLSLSAVYCLCEFGALLGGETQSVSIDAPAVVKSDKKAIKGDVDEQFNKFSSGRVQKQSERGVCFCLGVLIRTALLVAFVALSVSRNIAQVVNYGAPLHVWGAVAAAQTKISLGLQDTPIIANSSVCVGKEWYRFPSSFFLPHGRLLFLRSEFRGQLPQPFPAPIDGRPATFVEQSEFNDENTEVMSRYSELDQCDYIVDLDLTAQREEHFARNPNFRVVFKYPFLDASLSPQLTRAFWIPTMSSERNIMRPYQLLERVPRAPESAAQQD